MSSCSWLSCLCLSVLPLQEPGQETDPAAEAPVDPAEEDVIDPRAVDAMFHWRTGEIALGGGLARLALPDGFRYLEPREARTVLEEIWGNPPSDTLGMIFPADKGPIDDESWAVVLEYEADGYVSDEDASEIDYDELLADMQESTRDSNDEREEAGYGSIDLVGWAAPPRYDAAQHELFWAKELRFDGAPATTLNYDVRVLGRKGVLSMNAVADMAQLREVEQGMQGLLGAVEFTEGNRYEDFDSNLDEVAAYGIGGLIAGKIALKVGLFKGLLVALVAAKKLVIVAVVAIGAFVAKFFKRRKPAEAPQP